MSNYVSLKIKPETREKLQSLGTYNDTVDSIINRLIEGAKR
jgi:hypothetical protein